jgi:hydrogenase 3 maturation protease
MQVPVEHTAVSSMDTDELSKQLNKLSGSKTVIVGMGNVLKGDDGGGPLVCQQLQGKVCAELMDVGTVPENYIQSIIKKAPQNLLIIDAVDFGALPGTVSVFKPEQLNFLVISTHALSPRLFIDMIYQSIRVNVYFIGIQPLQTKLNKPLSVEVDKAVRQLSHIFAEVFPVT